MRQANPAQGAEQHVGHGSGPQTELVGTHGGRRGPVGKQIELTFLDAAFHFAASPLDSLIQMLPADLGRLERGDDNCRLASPPVTSALPMTRRWQLQLSSVDHMKSLKHRADLPVRTLSTPAVNSSALIASSKAVHQTAKAASLDSGFFPTEHLSYCQSKPMTPYHGEYCGQNDHPDAADSGHSDKHILAHCTFPVSEG